MAYKRSHLGPRTRAYTKAGAWALEVIVGSDPEIEERKAPPSEHGYGWKPIWLKLMNGRRSPAWMSLTNMTTEELMSFKRIIDLAYDEALVVVQDLDRQAAEVLLQDDVDNIPMRALASAPPWYERKISSVYDGPEAETPPPPPYEGEPWVPVDE